MRELARTVRGNPLDPRVRRFLRWWSVRWSVRLGSTLVAVVVLVELVVSGPVDRLPLEEADPPELERIDAAIASAEQYLDGLYRPLPDGRAVVSEYYGLPLLAYLDRQQRWIRPGDAGLTITTGEQSLLRESYLYEYALDDGSTLELLAVVRWDSADGSAEIEVSQVGGDLAEPLTLQLGDRSLVEERPSPAVRTFTTALAPTDRGVLRSLRYTVRHVAMMSTSAYRYRGQEDRSARLAALVRETGYDAEADLYAPIWGLGERQPDGFAFEESVYRDCDDPAVMSAMPSATEYYPYQSKVCTIPTWGYVAMSREDPLALLAQGLHVLQRHGDPTYEYSDGEHLHTTVVDLVTDLESRYRKFGGIAECLPGSCDTGATSTLRTVLFGMIETSLGFSRGDEIARTYADAIADAVLDHQVGPDGIVPTTTLGDLYRPDQIGGFFTHVSGDRAGEPDSFTRRQMSLLADLLDIRPEYTGQIATNAETTLAVYAFLVRYRCARFAVGCEQLP